MYGITPPKWRTRMSRGAHVLKGDCYECGISSLFVIAAVVYKHIKSKKIMETAHAMLKILPVKHRFIAWPNIGDEAQRQLPFPFCRI